jgi:hypothetical protein
MTRCNVPANPTTAKHGVTAVDDRSLSGRYRALRVVQSHMCAIIFQWRNCRNRTRMIIADLDRGFEFSVVAGGVDPGSGIAAKEAGVNAPGYSVPVHTIDLELLANQIAGIADDDAIC